MLPTSSGKKSNIFHILEEGNVITLFLFVIIKLHSCCHILLFHNAINILFSSGHRSSSSRELDFAAAGMAFFQRRCVRQRGPWSEPSTQLYRQGGSAPTSSTIKERHSSVVGSTTVDQLWLWKCFNFTYVKLSD